VKFNVSFENLYQTKDRQVSDMSQCLLMLSDKIYTSCANAHGKQAIKSVDSYVNNECKGKHKSTVFI